MGGKHAEGWSKVKEAEIVAVVDPIEERRERYAKTYNVKAFSDYRQAIALPEVNVVSVCIPTSQHPEVALLTLNGGKDVLCEKPIALTLEQADEMINTAREKNRKLGVGFMRRHSPVLHDLKKFLGEGKLGRPVMYYAHDFREMRPKREMHDAQANGGPVIDMAVHLFDLWSYIFDSRPIEVFAQGLTLAEERPEIAHIKQKAIDTATITVKYESGDVGNFTVTWGLPSTVNPPNYPDRIFGARGYAEVEFQMAHQSLRVIDVSSTAKMVSACDEDMYHREIANFARSILHDEPLIASGAEGKAALAVSLAALESIRIGKAVKL